LSDVKDKYGNPSVVGKGFVVEKEMECVRGSSNTHIWTERWFVARSDSHAERQNQSRTKRLANAETTLKKLIPKKKASPFF